MATNPRSPIAIDRSARSNSPIRLSATSRVQPHTESSLAMNTHSKTARAARTPRRTLGGFTLIEMLVAVIAVSLLTVGIVQVFRATTRTVAAGRKLSNILTYANILERQLREDVNRMSRQGVLVIRHANTDRPIQVYRADGQPRPRRVDELVFFAEGRFTSVRDPVNPSVQAEAAAARIYYGHGLRQEPDTFFTPPSLTDNNSTARPFGDGVNTFASDWILARHVTLMVPPRTSDGLIQDPTNPTSPLQAPQADERDSVIQIGQQPAAPHVFLGVSAATTTTGINSLRSNELGGQQPNFASGLIDIASCDLADVRTFTLSPLDARIPNRSDAPLRGTPVAQTGGDATAAAQGIQRVHQKLLDLLPAPSFAGPRIRVEPAPPNPLGIGFPSQITDAQRTDQRVLASHAFIPHCTEMIIEWSFGESVSASSNSTASSAIAGTPSEYGQLRWYGMPRLVTSSSGSPGVVQPYIADWSSEIRTALFFNTIKPVLSPGNPPAGARSLTARYFPDPNMFEANAGQIDQSFSLFGLVDPTWPPAAMSNNVPAPSNTPTAPVQQRITPDALRFWDFVDLSAANTDAQRDGAEYVFATAPDTSVDDPFAVLARDVNRNGAYEPNLGERLNYPASLPWKWPRLLRITVTLADPIDPSFERTFQFILDLPPDPTAQRN